MSWRRLEAGTEDPSLAEGLEARIADPAWLLARQWQSGEFRGDDAANPLLVSMEATSVPVERLRPPGGRPIPLGDRTLPLEPLVEGEDVFDGPARTRWAIDIGRMLIRALRRAGAPNELLQLIRNDGKLRPFTDELDPVGTRRSAVLAASAVNGGRLLQILTKEPDRYDNTIKQLTISNKAKQQLRAALTSWVQEAGHAMGGRRSQSLWDPERMEYNFSLEAGDGQGNHVRLDTGEGYTGGRLDWFSFNRRPGRGSLDSTDPVTRTVEVLPTPLRFRGMPAARFWEFEEGDIYLGGIEAGPQDLARVAVAGYGVVYGDDWFIVPLRLPYGTLTEITRLRIIDDFSNTPIEIASAAEVDGGRNDRAFKFFELTGDTNPRKDRAPLLFLAPTVATTDAARPTEDVAFLRDEAANLAWAVEQRIESAAGRPIDLTSRSGAPQRDQAGDEWTYALSSPVPDNWVPLVPVRLEDEEGKGKGGAAKSSTEEDGAIMFQRGRLPVEGGGRTYGARGEVLRPWERLLIHEEEIPRTGMQVVRRYQSARDASGRLHTWVGRQKRAGRGQGESGLEHDHLDTGQGD